MSVLEKFIQFSLSNNFLVWPLIFIVIISIAITIKLNFVQIRSFPEMIKMILFNKTSSSSADEQISPRSAMLISMSTAIGLGNIAGPIVALGIGGPSVMIGFFVASFFGAAVIYLEIFLAVKYRSASANDGFFAGGAMEYLRKEFSPVLAVIYSLSLMFLLTCWTANQSNNLAILLESSGIPRIFSGLFLAIISFLVLNGGIKRLATLNDKLVPFMCALYLFCTLSVIMSNIHNLPAAISLIFSSIKFQPNNFGTGAFAGATMLSSVRWGIGRAIQANEVGVGTSTFPHSNTTSTNPHYQATIGMAPVFATAILTTLTGLAILVTDLWKEKTTVFNISLFFKIMQQTFPMVGPSILLLCGFLFGFGTILGNSFNSSRCYIYLFGKKNLNIFFGFCSVATLLGALANVKLVWDLVDFFVLPVAIPHLLAIFIIVFRKNIFSNKLT